MLASGTAEEYSWTNTGSSGRHRREAKEHPAAAHNAVALAAALLHMESGLHARPKLVPRRSRCLVAADVPGREQGNTLPQVTLVYG